MCENTQLEWCYGGCVCGRDGEVSKFQQTFYLVSGVIRKRAQHKQCEALQKLKWCIISVCCLLKLIKYERTNSSTFAIDICVSKVYRVKKKKIRWKEISRFLYNVGKNRKTDSLLFFFWQRFKRFTILFSRVHFLWMSIKDLCFKINTNSCEITERIKIQN